MIMNTIEGIKYSICMHVIINILFSAMHGSLVPSSFIRLRSKVILFLMFT